MHKIICTGNPHIEGIAKELGKIYENITFVSRSTGYDLLTNEGMRNFQEQLNEHTVLINNSHIGYGVKKRILRIAKDIWSQGHVINIGSYNEIKKYSLGLFESAHDATELRELGFDLGNEKFKVTHLMVGPFRSGVKPMSDCTMDPSKIAKTIKWVLEADFQIPIISAIEMSDYIRDWHKDIFLDYYSQQ